MKELVGFAVWHPQKGFYDHSFEGPIAYGNLSLSLIADVKDLNQQDGTNNRNGWRAVRIKVIKDGP